MKTPRPFVPVLLALTTAAAAPALEPPLVHVFDSPAGDDAGESNLHRGPDGTLYLTWCGPGAGNETGTRSLFVSGLASGSGTWSTPRAIVTTAELMENWADFPSLVAGTDGALWAQWFQNDGSEGHHAYRGWFARSTDRGHTWSAPAELGNEFVSLAGLSGGRVLAVWLENTAKTHARTAHEHGTAAMALRSRLLRPDGGTEREWTIDPDVCTCCQTALVTLPGDRVFVAYRGHTPEEIRDNLHATFTGGEWTTPRPLHADGWKIPGCPVNGPAADSHANSLATVWFTAAHGVARVLARLSQDADATLGPVVDVDVGRPMGRVDVAMLPDASAVVTWLEARSDERAAGIYARRLFVGGGRSEAMLLAESTQARASGFPRIVWRQDSRVVITYTEEGTPSHVRVVELDASALARARE